MATKTLGVSMPYPTLAAGTTVELGVSPFLEGEQATLQITFSPDAAGAGVVKVQGSPDGTTWTDTFILTGIAPGTANRVYCSKYMRLGVTTAGSAGTVSAYLVGIT